MSIKELPTSHFIPLDDEERELIEAEEQGEWRYLPATPEQIALHKATAKNTIREREKKRRITVYL